MLKKSKAIKHDSRCTLVNLLLCGRKRRDNQRWCSVTFICACWARSVLNVVNDSIVETGSRRSICPSSWVKDSQVSQRNTTLVKVVPVSVQEISYKNMEYHNNSNFFHRLQQSTLIYYNEI